MRSSAGSSPILRWPLGVPGAQSAQSRRYVDGTDVDFGDAAGDDGGGDVGDTCGEACGSAPSLVDAGRGTTLLRRRLVSAKTPWNRVRFAYVGGIQSKVNSKEHTSVPPRPARP